MLQRLICRKIAAANMFILEVVIIVQINPLVATRWKYGHAHFWRLAIVFATKNSPLTHLLVLSHFQIKVGSKSVWSGQHKVLVVVAGLDKATFQCIVICQRRACWPCPRADVFKCCMSFKWPINAFGNFNNEKGHFLAKLHFNTDLQGIHQAKYRWVGIF